MAARYKRSDKHPSNVQLVFWRYYGDREVWISVSEYERRKADALSYDKDWKQTPQGKETSRKYFRGYMNRPYQKAKQSAYYKRSDVRAKIREKHNSKPEVVAKREARLAWRKKRAEYRKTDEYKAILKERHKRTYRKRQLSGKNAAYWRNKRRTNAQYRLASNMRIAIAFALTRNMGAVKAARTFELIGCSVSALRIHLESQFTEGMTWANYGSVWHVDHRLPLSLFNLTDAKQQRIAFHFENLRPLLAADNIRKSDRVTVDGKEVRGRNLNKLIPFKAA